MYYIIQYKGHFPMYSITDNKLTKLFRSNPVDSRRVKGNLKYSRDVLKAKLRKKLTRMSSIVRFCHRVKRLA